MSREEIRAALSAEPALADRIRIEEKAPLSALTGFRTGGPATVARPQTEAALNRP